MTGGFHERSCIGSAFLDGYDALLGGFFLDWVLKLYRRQIDIPLYDTHWKCFLFIHELDSAINFVVLSPFWFSASFSFSDGRETQVIGIETISTYCEFTLKSDLRWGGRW